MEESKAVKIVKSLINLVGVTAGIIIASIGAIMFLNSIFNLYVFDIREPEYSHNDYECAVFDIDRIEARMLTGIDTPEIMLDGPHSITAREKAKSKISKLTKEQKDYLRTKYTECKKEMEEKNQKRFITGEKRHIATGLAFMIVGFPLMYFYQRKRKKA